MCDAHGLRKVSGLLLIIVFEFDICRADQIPNISCLCPKLLNCIGLNILFSFFASFSHVRPLFLLHTSSKQMPLDTLMLRRKKVGKVFPVKISTMDAELEFSLDYKVIWPIADFLFVHALYFSRQLDRNSSTLSVGQSASEKPGK